MSPQGNYPHNMFVEFPFSVDEGRGGNVLVIPVPPEQIVASVDGILATHSIISLGEVLAVGSRKLQSMGWESHFPAIYDESIEVATETEHVSPLLWRSALVRVMDSKSTIRLSIENFEFDQRMAVRSFKYSVIPGPLGDIWYQLELMEHRQGFLRIVKGAEIPTTGFRQRPYGDLPSTYVTRPNQTLQDIAALLYGSMDYWVDLLAANYVNIITKRDIPSLHRDPWEGVGHPERDPYEGVGDLWRPDQKLPTGTILTVPRPSAVTHVPL